MGEVVPVDRLDEGRYGIVICYPKPSHREFVRRLDEMRRLGVEAIEFTGQKLISNIPVLGKGCVGIVVIAHTEAGRAALKIRRVDADRAEMRREALLLERANSVGVGPRLLSFTDNLLLMEFIDGMLLPDWVSSLIGGGENERIRMVLRDILTQSYRLDRIGLDHGELSQASKHIIVGPGDRAYIIDFESASLDRRVSNLTSVSQFLFISGRVANMLRSELGEFKGEEALIESLKAYKRNPTEENFLRVLRVCGL